MPAALVEVADRDDGLAPPAAGDRDGGEKTDSAELRKLRRRNKLLEQENEILSCTGRRPASPATSFTMIYSLVRELAAETIPVAVTCRVLGFAMPASYAWCRNPVSQRDWDDAYLINAAYDIHRDDPALGDRFIADELHRRGLATGENRVARLCSQQRIWSVFAKKRGLNRIAALERPAPCAAVDATGNRDMWPATGRATTRRRTSGRAMWR